MRGTRELIAPPPELRRSVGVWWYFSLWFPLLNCSRVFKTCISGVYPHILVAEVMVAADMMALIWRADGLSLPSPVVPL